MVITFLMGAPYFSYFLLDALAEEDFLLETFLIAFFATGFLAATAFFC